MRHVSRFVGRWVMSQKDEACLIICAHTYTYIYMRRSPNVCMGRVSKFVGRHPRTHCHAFCLANIHTYAYICICTYIYIYIYIHIHIHMCCVSNACMSHVPRFVGRHPRTHCYNSCLTAQPAAKQESRIYIYTYIYMSLGSWDDIREPIVTIPASQLNPRLNKSLVYIYIHIYICP